MTGLLAQMAREDPLGVLANLADLGARKASRRRQRPELGAELLGKPFPIGEIERA
jgi:hypothetical protein